MRSLPIALILIGVGLLLVQRPGAVGGLQGVAYHAALRVPAAARPFTATLAKAYGEAGAAEYTTLLEVQQHVLDRGQRAHGEAFSIGWYDWFRTTGRELAKSDRDPQGLKQSCADLQAGLQRVQ